MKDPAYYVLLGKSADLAFAELEALAKRYGFDTTRISTNLAATSHTNINILINHNGGIVKIYQPIPLATTLFESISHDLITLKINKFALSSLFFTDPLKELAKEVKNQLQKQLIKPHFTILETPYAYTGEINQKNDYLITSFDHHPLLLRAVIVQQLNRWNIKDYYRPLVNPHAGMLPPKIARMMINLALPKPIDHQTHIYDPFCGSGTILTEALDLGINCTGSDISVKAVEASNQNCTWFNQQFSPPGKFQLFVNDATHVHSNQLTKPLDAIVFEGYLGPPQINPLSLNHLTRGLDKLYKGTLKNLFSLLKPGNLLVCALPEYTLNHQQKNLDSTIKWASDKYFTYLSKYIYGRNEAMVKRAIYVLQKKAN